MNLYTGLGGGVAAMTAEYTGGECNGYSMDPLNLRLQRGS